MVDIIKVDFLQVPMFFQLCLLHFTDFFVLFMIIPYLEQHYFLHQVLSIILLSFLIASKLLYFLQVSLFSQIHQLSDFIPSFPSSFFFSAYLQTTLQVLLPTPHFLPPIFQLIIIFVSIATYPLHQTTQSIVFCPRKNEIF